MKFLVYLFSVVLFIIGTPWYFFSVLFILSAGFIPVGIVEMYCDLVLRTPKHFMPKLVDLVFDHIAPAFYNFAHFLIASEKQRSILEQVMKRRD